VTQKEHVGFGSINSLGSVLCEYFPKKILLVTGKTSFLACGAERLLKPLLEGYKVEHFCDFANNPKIGDVYRGVELFRKNKPDVVIAVGGGSVIDMAKTMNFFGSNKLDPFTYISNKTGVVQKSKPLIAVPTTAGSGSEATHFAVLYADKIKYSVEHEHILPDVAIVDPALTMSLPASVTAWSGMDALSQAIESYWSIHSNEQSKAYASESMRLLIPNLPVAVNRPTASARLAMAYAAHLSGKAINLTKTTAPHAISYPLTSYFGIVHGHAVALTLSPLLVYNFQVTQDDLLDHRGCDYVRATIKEIAELLGADDVLEASEKIDGLMSNIGLETKLRALGVGSDEDIEKIVVNGFNPERVRNNPRILTEDALRTILYSIY